MGEAKKNLDGPAQPGNAGLALALLVAATFFMENLDATVITPAIPRMAASFQAPPVALNTGISAYTLTLGIFIPVSGWIAERFGARRVFAAAIALFTAASLLCGLADSLPAFVASRILQGLGGAMMVPVGRFTVLSSTPKESLISAIATLTWPALVAPVLGPPLGGLIADHLDWRWIFYLNLPLGLATFALAWILVPPGGGEKRAPFDWLGFGLIGGALFLLLYAIELLGRPDPDWWRTAPAAIAGAGLLAAGIGHLRRADHPMVGLGALSVPTFAVTIWGGSLFRMGVSAVPFLLPLMFQIGFGFSAFEAGATLMAVFAGNLAMKPLTTPILRRFGFRPVLVGNGLLNALLIAGCALLAKDSPLWFATLLLFAGGMPRSMQFTAINTIAFADIPKSGMAAANTLFSTAIQLTVGLGIALGAVSWRFGERLVPEGDPAQPFRIAFLIIGAVSLLAIADAVRLAREAGAHVTKAGRPKRP